MPSETNDGVVEKDTRKLRLKLLLMTLFLLVLAQAFNASLSLSAFEKALVKSLISNYQVHARDFARNVDSALRFGKPLTEFYGIDKYMQEVKEYHPELANVSVGLPEGQVLYSLEPSQAGQTLPDALKIDFSQVPADAPLEKRQPTILINQTYYLLLPLKNRDQQWIGTVILDLPKSVISQRLTPLVEWNMKILGMVIAAAAALLTVSLMLFIRLKGGQLPRVRIYVILLTIMGGAQVVYSVVNADFFKKSYLELTRENSATLTNILKQDVEFLLSKGLKLDRLVKIDDLMNEITNATPEIEAIRILNNERHVLYQALRGQGVQKLKEGEQQELTLAPPKNQEESLYQIELPLHKGETIEGQIQVQLSQKVIGERVRETMLDSGTVVVISFLFIVELVIVLLVLTRTTLREARGGGHQEDPEYYAVIRPAAFLYFFAMDLSMSFLPLHMQSLYQPLWGLSREVITGLPISVEMFCAGLMLITGGGWMDRRGWQEPFFVGIICSAVGFFLSAVAPGPIQFVAARGVVGMGFGCVWIASQGFVLKHSTTQTRARGMASLVAGVYAGSICGAAVGGMLAERIGYRPVFFVAMGGVWLAMIFAFLFMRSSFEKPRHKSLDTLPQPSWDEFRKFIFDREIWALVFLKTIPAAMLFVGFLYYLCPLYLHRLGVAQANIGRALMLYGLFMIYLAPLISKWVDRSPNKLPYITLSGIIGSAGLLSFYILDGFAATVVVILMLSLSSSIGAAARTVYVYSSDAAKRLGEGRAMGAYRALERLGQVMGPLTLGGIIGVMSIESGAILVGGVALLAALGFILVVRPRTRQES